MKHVAEYFKLAREREEIRLRRASGHAPPWTKDPIFATWRFCNVRREDDKTTVWFREHVRGQVKGLQAVLAVLAFRWFNRIEVGERIVDQLLNTWQVREVRRRLLRVHPVTTGSFITRTPWGMNKLDGVLACISMAHRLVKPMWPVWGDTLQQAWEDLLTVPYLGRFTAYEVVSDLRWTPVLGQATDINTWASAGPGCARGLGMVVAGRADHFKYGTDEAAEEMTEVMRQLLECSQSKRLWPYDVPWEMREVEHWACEYYKYVRCRDDGIPPRQRLKLK